MMRLVNSPHLRLEVQASAPRLFGVAMIAGFAFVSNGCGESQGNAASQGENSNASASSSNANSSQTTAAPSSTAQGSSTRPGGAGATGSTAGTGGTGGNTGATGSTSTAVTSSSASTSRPTSSETGTAGSEEHSTSQDSTGATTTSQAATSTSSSSASEDTDVTSPQLEVVPSPGCSGGSSSATISNSVIDKPTAYDSATPVPVLFAFHGAGGNASSLQGNFAGDAKERGYIGVYLKSTGSGWSLRDDAPVLTAAYETLLEDYCVDVNRVFAVGHSSGAQMITQLLCDGEDRFRAVAPVASSKYCNGWDATAAIVIHGLDDIERGGQGENRYGLDDGDGHKDFAVYQESNQCTDASTAFDPGGNCGADIHPGCVEYDDCAVRTVFCNHDDPQYGTSNHGVPCFASQVMFDFFDEF